MIDAQMEIIVTASMTAVACAIPGTFLVLRKMTMLADAVSHSIILGIVLAFFVVQSIDSPLLVLAAGLTGIITVLLVESLIKTKLVKEDAAIGVVYPLMFSVAVVLISLFASQVHIDTDSVLMGELAFVPLNRMVVDGMDLGPVAYYQIGAVALLNIILVTVFYKEIKLSVFDPDYALAIGFKPKSVNYVMMVAVSFTTVVAFEVAGSIMVVGFIVGPAVIASLFTKRLWLILMLACLTGITASVAGYSAAHYFDVSIAGSIISTLGLFFIASLIFSPFSGVFVKNSRRKKASQEFALDLLLVHLFQHESIGDADEENHISTIAAHFNWNGEFMSQIIGAGKSKEYFYVDSSETLILEKHGVKRACTALES